MINSFWGVRPHYILYNYKKKKKSISLFLNYDIRELVPLDMFGFMATPKNIMH